MLLQLNYRALPRPFFYNNICLEAIKPDYKQIVGNSFVMDNIFSQYSHEFPQFELFRSTLNGEVLELEVKDFINSIL